MCDCFDRVEANLKEKTGDPEASLNYMYAMPSFEKKPVIEATYRNKKKDGTFNKQKVLYPLLILSAHFAERNYQKENNSKLSRYEPYRQ